MNRTFRNRQRRGVTLIEAIMVITLLAAAAATGSIMFDGQWIAGREVTAVTNDVANTLMMARDTAITNQTIVRVRRERLSGIEQLLITQDPGPFGSGKSWTVELGGAIRLRGGPREVRFSATGNANRTLDWTIRQSQTSGRVNVASINGQVTRQLP